MPVAMKSQFTIDVGSLSRLSRTLKRASPEMAVNLAVALRVAGDIVANEARSRSSWSTRIPGSITVTGGRASVRVSAGGAAAPHAPAFEHGGRDGNFRHPVFGHLDRWVPQAARPFLTRALEAKADELALEIDRAIDKTIETFVNAA